MPDAQAGLAPRVTTLELFFDLVFVFTITQLTELLHEERLALGSLQAATLLAIIFYMYGGYAWLTNAVVLDSAARRLAMLTSMLGYLVVALAIPTAYDDGALPLAVAYAAIVALHLGLYRLTASPQSRAGIRAVAPSNALGAALVLAGALAGGTAQHVLWLAAVAVLWILPLLRAVASFDLTPAHFIERHGLVVLVAIGESVVAIGIGARGLEVDGGLIGVAALALCLNALLWWTYFGGDDERATGALQAMPRERRGVAALVGYGHCHLLLLAGVIAVAAGLTEVVAHPGRPLGTPAALELAGGAALFLAGEAGLRAALGLERWAWRALAAPLLLLTVPLGVDATAWSMLLALVVLYGATLVAEPAGAPVQPAVA